MDRQCGSSPSSATQSCSAEQSKHSVCVSRRLKMEAVRASALRPMMHRLGAAPSRTCSDRGRRPPSSSMTSTSRALALESDPSDGSCAHGETNATAGRRDRAARNMFSQSGEIPAKATRTVRTGISLVQRRRSIGRRYGKQNGPKGLVPAVRRSTRLWPLTVENGGSLDPAAQIELVQNVVHVVFCGCRLNSQSCRDDLVRQSVSQQLQHLLLA